MSDVTQRIARYQAKLIPTRLKDLLDGQLSGIQDNAVKWFVRQAEIRDRVLGILTGEAVVTINYPKYYSFALQVDKAKRKFGGGSGLTDETALLVTKWKGRGCTEAILDKIRNEVFAIPAPAGP